jgi:DNA-binding CsgD family transcriptional regulator
MSSNGPIPIVDWSGIEFAQFAVASLSKSKNPAMFCQILVHEVFLGTSARAAMVGEADSRGRVEILGSYGYENAAVVEKPLAIWDDRAICKSIRENSLVAVKNQEVYRAVFPKAETLGLPGDGFLAIPFGRERARYCALGVAFEDELSADVAESPATPFLGSLAALVLFRPPTADLFPWESAESAGLLTKRQRRLIQLAADGATNPQISRELHISESLVKQELGKSMRLLGVKGRRELSRRAVELGVVTLEIS